MTDGQNLDFGGLLKKVEEAANRLVNLKVVTYVGVVKVSGTMENLKVSLPAKGNGKAFVTNINLLDSDITTIMPEGNAGEDSGVLDFHREQVDRAMSSMERKAKLLVSLVNDVIPAIQGAKGTGGTPEIQGPEDTGKT